VNVSEVPDSAMKHFPMHRKNLWTLVGCLLAAGALLMPAAADNAIKGEVLQNTADEQDVRQHTAVVVSEAQALIDELAANGISGDDVKVLNATKAALTNLSGPEMERIIASLKKASDANTTAEGEKHVVQAYGEEKSIILQFRQILKDYEQRQAAYELPLLFKELAQRQDDTLNTTVAVARQSAGKSQVELNTMNQTTQQIAQADQDAIGNEVALAQQSLEKAAKESTDDSAKNFQKAEKDMQTGVLQKGLNDANDTLKQGHLLQAITAQKIARDELRKIAKDLAPDVDAVDALKDTAAAIDKLIQEEKALLAETNAAVDVKPKVTGLDDKQGVIVNETDSLAKDTQTLSASAADLVGQAIPPMQSSRTSLGPQGAFAKAATSEEDAIAKLEAAEAQVNQQIAEAQKAADDAAKDPVAKLQDLQKQIQALQQAQQQLNSQTAQANNPPNPATAKATQQPQSQIQQQTTAAQNDAQPVSLPASQALADAANQMNQAQQAFANQATAATPEQAAQQAAAGQAAQQAAAQALAQAGQQVAQQLAQAQQQPADPAALAQAADALQQAQTDVSTALANTPPAPPAAAGATPPAGAPPAGAPPANMAAAAAALAQAAKDTATAAQTPGLPPDAAANVKEAQADIAKGEDAAKKDDAAGTATAAAGAEQALAQAQASVAMAQAGLAGSGPPQPGGPPGGPPMPGGPPQPGDMPSDITATSINTGSTTKGTLHDVQGNGKFITVTSRDRAAIAQTQTEKRPQEFAPMIDQYMKNLSDQASAPR